jgi:hypothetical protein
MVYLFIYFVLIYLFYFILLEAPQATMHQIYGAKDRNDERQLYETPPSLTQQMLYIASQYGFFQENTVIGELFNGNGMLSRELRKENYTVITRDKYTGEDHYDFLRDPIPDGVNLLLTNPPFRGKREFFQRLEMTSKWLLFLFYIIFFQFISLT